VFRFSGTVTPGTHTLTVPVDDPAALFANALRAALHRQGIEGALPLRRQAPAGTRRELLFSHYSPALREAIGPILRDSDNLAADTLLWTLAAHARQGGRGSAPDAQDGLRWVQRIVQQDFPGIQTEVELADGSGLNADSRFSARALVRVLSGALARPDFGPEFQSALSRAGWDGTLHYRSYPAAIQGRLRAKTGTLTGVQNLTGTFPLAQDEIVFAFLISAPGQPRLKLQAAQDRIVAGLLTALRKEEIVTPDRDPLAPRVLKPPPASPKPGRKRQLAPPASSPKPKAGGGGAQAGVG
jgi:D-alanyl-D-alanine carboxypeptidase/D-alanyl-D-alanine-endopeptidase (penicillin-binding protein 4)